MSPRICYFEDFVPVNIDQPHTRLMYFPLANAWSHMLFSVVLLNRIIKKNRGAFFHSVEVQPIFIVKFVAKYHRVLLNYWSILGSVMMSASRCAE